MFCKSVKSKTTMKFGTMAVAAVALLIASSLIVGSQQALAANLCGTGLASPDNFSGTTFPR
jgi:hypothetical protein